MHESTQYAMLGTLVHCTTLATLCTICFIHSYISGMHNYQCDVRSAKHRQQSPEWTILSHVSCFIEGEVHWFQVLLGSLHPRSTGASVIYPEGMEGWSPPVLWGGSR